MTQTNATRQRIAFFGTPKTVEMFGIITGIVERLELVDLDVVAATEFDPFREIVLGAGNFLNGAIIVSSEDMDQSLEPLVSYLDSINVEVVQLAGEGGGPSLSTLVGALCTILRNNYREDAAPRQEIEDWDDLPSDLRGAIDALPS